jgi:cysteine desulfurase
VEKARGEVAALIGAGNDEIIFTGGGTESNNLAIQGVINAYRRSAGEPHVVTSAIEHPSVLHTCRMMEERGVAVTYVPCGADGAVRADRIAGAMRKRTVLVSVMLANNETGVIQPVAEIGRLVKNHTAHFHVDAVQGAGRMEVHVDGLGADLLSLSAHKFYGPKGIGALYVRRGTTIAAVQAGGGQERALRPGTENVPAIVGLGEACRCGRELLVDEAEHLARLRDRLERNLLAACEDVTINGTAAPRLVNTSSVTAARVEAEAVALNLNVLGFAVSSRSACASRSGEPSYVLRAMGLDLVDAQSTIRISLGRENTVQEIDDFTDAFARVVRRLRDLSPL